MVGFEPTFSSTPSWRIAKLSHILIQSVQGDLNPRIHHGKVAGCQATSWTRVSPKPTDGHSAGSSGGWGRASDLPLFRRTLLPSELHRKVPLTPTLCRREREGRKEPAVGFE